MCMNQASVQDVAWTQEVTVTGSKAAWQKWDWLDTMHIPATHTTQAHTSLCMVSFPAVFARQGQQQASKHAQHFVPPALVQV